MPFEKFTGKGSGGGQTATEPRLSLRRSGTIGLNNAAIEEYFEGKDWVVLYYDKFNELIGLEPTVDEEEGAYKVRKSKKENHGGNINCKAFIREYGLKPDKTTRYDLNTDDKGEMLVIDLDEPVKTISS